MVFAVACNSCRILRSFANIQPCECCAMSSPATRRSTRSSVNGTPSRRSETDGLPQISSPAGQGEDAADEQLRSEASQAEVPGSDAPMQDLTPRAEARFTQNTSQSQAPPTSSPLFMRSSPTGSHSQSQNLGAPRGVNGVGASSPLGRSVVASSEDGRTPRARGGLGGEWPYGCRTQEKR